MKYSELLLRLYEIVIELKKQKDKSYVPQGLFLDLKNLLYLENVCDLYYSRINELNDNELKNFKDFAGEDGKVRRKFIENYNKEYNNGKIKDVFSSCYKNISDYIATVFINELGDLLLSPEFMKLFNNNIRCVYEQSPDLLSCFRIFSSNYRNLGVKNENIGKTFKNLLKEFIMLSKMYKINGIKSIKLYDLNNKMLKLNNEVFEIVNKYIPIKNNLGSMLNLSDILIEIENKDDFFSNKYIPLLLDITNQDSGFGTIIKNNNNENSLIIALILNKLMDKDFLDSITTSDNYFDSEKLCEIMNKLDDNKIQINCEYDFYEVYNYYKKVNDIFEQSKINYQDAKNTRRI